jgi:hypothetical protein
MIEAKRFRGLRTMAIIMLAMLVAGIMGQFFVQSGYQDDNFPHGMTTFFIVSLILYFVELYLLKPAPSRPD